MKLNSLIHSIKLSIKLKKSTVIINKTNANIAILKCLRQEGYINNFKVNKSKIIIFFKYNDDKNVIYNLNYFPKKKFFLKNMITINKIYFSNTEKKLFVRHTNNYIYNNILLSLQ